MSFNKIIGWALLLAGLAVIIFCLFYSYNIFTAKEPAPAIFKLEKTEPSLEGAVGGLDQQAQEAISAMLEQQLGNMLPADSIPQLLNLLSWSVFAGILIFGGGKISSLGIQLVKK